MNTSSSGEWSLTGHSLPPCTRHLFAESESQNPPMITVPFRSIRQSLLPLHACRFFHFGTSQITVYHPFFSAVLERFFSLFFESFSPLPIKIRHIARLTIISVTFRQSFRVTAELIELPVTQYMF